MDLLPHFLISAGIALAFYPAVGWLSVFILIGGWIIDVDHYIFFVIRDKEFNPFKIMRDCRNRKNRPIAVFCLFHTIEFILFMTIFSMLSVPILLFTLGNVIHVLFDIALNQFGYLSKYSIIGYLNDDMLKLG